MYVRRGAKRASLATERTNGGGVSTELIVAALSGVDHVSEIKEENNDTNPNNVNKSGGTGAGTGTGNSGQSIQQSIISLAAAEKVTSFNQNTTNKVLAIEKQKLSGNSLYLCLGRENSGDNGEENDTAVLEESEESESVCNLKYNRNLRKCRLAKRSSLPSTLSNQKSDPCIIL